MKHFILSIALGIFFYTASCPQSVNSNLRTLDYSRLKQQMLLPSRSQASGIEKLIDALKEWNNNRLNKNDNNSEVNSAAYKPVKITADSSYRMTFTYDDKGNQLTFLQEDWQNGAWVNFLRVVAAFNSDGKILTEKSEQWEDDTWKYHRTWNNTYTNADEYTVTCEYWYADSLISSDRQTYTKNGNETVCVMELLTNGQWLIKWRFTSKYDNNGNLLEYLEQGWNNGTWDNSYRETYEYNTDGKVITYTFWDWYNESWIVKRRDTYTYDAAGRELTRSGSHGTVTHTYDSRGNELTFIEDYMGHTYTYDNNDFRLADTYEERYGNVWRKHSRFNYTNDINGNTVKIEALAWKDSTWKRGSVLSPISFMYNGGKESWSVPSAPVIEIEYNSITGVETAATAVKQFTLSQNYPNPFNPETTINYTVKEAGNIKLTVFDALGKKAAVIVNEYKPAGSYSIKFDGRGLPSGVYLYRLEAGKLNTSKKFILMK